MATSPSSISAEETLYSFRLADFEAAYQKRMNASGEYTAVLMMTPSDGLSIEERKARVDSAAQAYRAAHERFMAAIRDLQMCIWGARTEASPESGRVNR